MSFSRAAVLMRADADIPMILMAIDILEVFERLQRKSRMDRSLRDNRTITLTKGTLQRGTWGGGG